MTLEVSFRAYTSADQGTCLAIFDANCPLFFAPNERIDYRDFLDALPEGYEVCQIGERIVAAFGLIREDESGYRLNWIMLHPDTQGKGVGSVILERVITQGRKYRSRSINIAASNKSAPFFAKFGAVAIKHTEDGWGKGLDRIDMELPL